jgi:flagellar hook-associated protein 2
MATTAVSNSTSNAGAAAIAAMGAGSGMDVKALAQAIVDAQKTPQADAINKKIDQSKAKISGYSAVRYVLDQLKTAFLDINTTSDFNALTLSNSQTSAFTATATTSASAGSHTIAVTTLANSQRSASPAYADSTSDIAGLTTPMTLTVGSGAPVTLTPSGNSPTAVAQAINDQTASTGVSAQLVRTSTTGQYKIVVSGPSGADNTFSLQAGSLSLTPDTTDNSTPPVVTAGVGLLQSAQDAELQVDGLSVKRSTNRIDDVITGVTLDLNGATTGAANLNLALNTTPVATKISALVDAYNQVQTVLTDAYNKDSKTAEYGASLVGDSTVQSIRSEVRAMFFPPTGSTGNNITSLRDLGVSVDAKGVMTLDQAKLSTSLQTNFAGAVTMLTNNVNGSYISSTDPNGVANDAINKLTSLLSNDGLLVVQSNNAAKKITDYQDQLTKLNDRMTALLDRYNKQFAAMETIVGQSKSLQTSLTSTFANMNSSSSK